MKKLSFDGTENALRTWLSDIGLNGRWFDEPNGVKMFRCTDGGQIHWSSTKNTIWATGKAERRLAIERLLFLETLFHEDDDDEDFYLID